ncbi:RecB family exonuclease [Arthrobacter crystallopoietes BAB-32]|uniref:RecB family exonuclease n=1 Tax=Arthrobacter crystallopoietes BAB-32 TaxID=1246476 RepID=N1V5P5_9MICC|nr:hypothetical protein [Arthrobacter crystallopoietes]EMY35412.1 RecB family exonuclease [Arthrobacter crystallopoietes BAB-32]
MYGLFARRLSEIPAVEVEAEYWFISLPFGETRRGYAVTNEVIETLRADATRVITAMRRGYFPPKPESGQFASFSTMMGRDGMQQAWHGVSGAEELRDIAALLGGEK